MFVETNTNWKKNLENKGLVIYNSLKTFCKAPNVSELLFPHQKRRISDSIFLLMFLPALTFSEQPHFMCQRIITINNDLFLLEKKECTLNYCCYKIWEEQSIMKRTCGDSDRGSNPSFTITALLSTLCNAPCQFPHFYPGSHRSFLMGLWAPDWCGEFSIVPGTVSTQ